MDANYRLFIAIELPAEVRAALREARLQLEAHGRLTVRWADPDGAHLTLKFLGATAPDRLERIAEGLAEAARPHRAFALRTTDLGVFPGSRAPRVVWLGVGGDLAQLRALQGDVERLIAPLGFPTERRAFSPHLTLGRTEKLARGHELTAIGAALGTAAAPSAVVWQVAHLALMWSERLQMGARYTALRRVALDTSPAAVIIAPADEPGVPQRD